MPDGRVCPDHFRGWLWKWTNYIKGYQKRWFVLSNGLLSYYRNQAEMAHHCRGTINLSGAFIDTEDSCSFIISNGGTQVFHLRASSEVERQRWVTALELAKAKAIKMLESDDEDEFNSEESGTKTLSQKVEDLQTCNELVTKHGSSLQRAIGDLQELESQDNLLQKLKIANEKATLFRITSNAMISACAEFLELAQSQEKKWQKLLQNERNQRLRLEETVECLAKQHNTLERQCQKKTGSSPTGTEQSLEDTKPDSDEDDDHEFFDAISEHPEILNAFKDDSSSEMSEDSRSISSEQSFTPLLEGNFGKNPLERQASQQSTDSSISKDSLMPVTISSEDLQGSSDSTEIISKAVRKYRDSIPEKPDISINLWSILKNCIGRELSKIPMPINFNEPLSMLQRLVEELEYSYILDRAAECENSLDQMCHVAAFTVSSYSTTCNRTTKPFNPLLGETYECDRTGTLGWWSLCEQVSHHPPASAMHAEHKDWIFWQEFTATSKFRGKYLSIIPQGVAHLKFNKTGNHYTWRRVATTVHNIIVGRLWIDNSGTMEIVNDVTGDKCHLDFAAYNYFSRETPRKVTGYATDSQNIARYYMSGTWDNKMEAGKIVYNKSPKGQSKAQTLPPTTLWKRVVPPPRTEKMYNFTEFALTLNQPEEDVAPTDSRLRPDQRLMEEGKWDEANQEKLRIEDKQRAVRRKREADAAEAAEEGKVYESYKPVWFEKIMEGFTEIPMHVYKGGYWEAKEKMSWLQEEDLF